MTILAKLLLAAISFVMIFTHYDYGNTICETIAICAFLYLSYNLYNTYKMFMDYKTYVVKGNEYTSISDNDFREFNFESYDTSYTYNTSSDFNAPKIKRRSVIELIENNFSVKKKNFVEFIGDKKKAEYTSNYKPKCESVTKRKVTRNSKFDGGEVLMIKNSEFVDGVDKIVYDSIIEVINTKTLKPNERYALLQSFYHIDVVPMMINIYIDRFILAKANLTEEHIYKDEIIKKIKGKLKDENTVIVFSDLKAVNLLNYYLKL